MECVRRELRSGGHSASEGREGGKLDDMAGIFAAGNAQRLRAENRCGHHEVDVGGVLSMMIQNVGDGGVEGKGVWEEFVATPEAVAVVVNAVLLPLTPPFFESPGTGE